MAPVPLGFRPALLLEEYSPQVVPAAVPAPEAPEARHPACAERLARPELGPPVLEAGRTLARSPSAFARPAQPGAVLLPCSARLVFAPAVLWTVEAPANSWFWEQPPVAEEIRGANAEVVEETVYHHCVRGGVTSDTVH